ncbi:MAG: peptide ABC transporter substrate-binding protein [Chloroflexi bacterium]|nr:peptide ABC transporter substrate-binding protein [Chloroflexota bacterium]
MYGPRWPLLITLVAGVSILIGVAYLPSRPAGEEVPAQGGAYVEGITGEPAVVNPLYASFNQVDRDLSSLVFSGLVRLGPKGGVQSDLADLPNITQDGLTYIFELEPGLFWHDGEPLDAEDVLFTIEAIKAPGFDGDPVLADLYSDVEVEAASDLTVVMTLAQPFAPFLARAATVGILPEHLLSDIQPSALREASFNRRPVGSGPFRLVELTSTSAQLVPFAASPHGRPFLEHLELRFFRDEGALLNAFLSGEVDGALFRPGLDTDAMLVIDNEEQWVRRVLHTTAYSLVYLNTLQAPFDSRFVREALQRGLDRSKLFERVLAGQALPLDSPIVRDLWAYVGAPDEYDFDPVGAAALLADAGWVLEDDVLARDGETLSFSLSVSDDHVQVALAEELARQWGELGINVDLQVSGASVFVEGVLLPREFETALVTIDPGPDPDPYPLWHSSQVLGDGRNLSSFSNLEVDRLLENGRQTTSDGERAEAYRTFQDIFAEELPAVLLHTLTYQYVVTAELQGLSPGLLVSLSSRFDDVSAWYIETGSQSDAAQTQ